MPEVVVGKGKKKRVWGDERRSWTPDAVVQPQFQKLKNLFGNTSACQGKYSNLGYRVSEYDYGRRKAI